MNKGKGRRDSGKGSGAARTETYSGSHSSGNNVKNARPRSRDSSEERDFSLPVLRIIDKGRNLHCYSSVLSRSGEEAISMEDVDRLQGELETLLSSVADRRRTLQAELAALNGANPEDRYVARTHSQEKRRKLNDSRSSKSFKDLSKIRESIKIEQSSVHSSENETDNSTEHPAPEEKMDTDGLIPKVEPPPDPPLPENDLPNRFWAYVEPYCADISQDSIKTLEDMIAACSEDMGGIKIPPLGEHYTLRWAQEEMSEERDAAAGRRPGPPSHTDTAKSILRQTNTNSRDRTTGPFTQRLVSALMEENFTSPLSDSCNNYKLDDEYFAKLPLYHTTACFERRLRKELEVIGLVDPKEEETDQIYEELIKCEDELRSVAARNKELLEKTLVQARRELQRQEVRTKIRAIDQEILDIYKRVNAAKLKKIQVSRKLKELAWKALKDREALYKNLAVI